MNRFFATVFALTVCACAYADRILLEAEAFECKGGWKTDQQFMDIMYSPYLIAHGMGNPVENAYTSFNVGETGMYDVYVRTYNWTSPWHSGKGPGAFAVGVDGKRIGVTGNTGDSWAWQHVGKAKLKSGNHKFFLKDLTGFDGRCDAVYITSHKDDVPQEKCDAGWREKLNPRRTTDGKFDFVVVGGGIAGMCAAVTAARLGLRVALVNDRPVWGGNNSSEVRVHLGGNIEMGANKGLGRLIREFGPEKGGNAQPSSFYEDSKKEYFLKAEKNITLYPGFRAVGVVMNGEKIASVSAVNIESGDKLLLSAPLFADCTGDATVGVLAGADWRMGREGKDEFHERYASDVPDSMTMGASVQWYSVEGKEKFPEFKYGMNFNDSNCEQVLMGEWTWETGMNRNQITQAEQIRDYGMLTVYSNWSWLKNHSDKKAKYSDRKLGWVAYVAGKRESRRLMGDYILKEDDILKNVYHEDASFPTTWSIDLHFPDSLNHVNFPGREFKSATNHRLLKQPYDVPYRCLYSRNVSNLFMAGRNISVTHVVLGTTRVMRTTGMQGEVVGMAASLCKKHSVLPRGVYHSYLPELKALMQKGIGKQNVPDNQNYNYTIEPEKR